MQGKKNIFSTYKKLVDDKKITADPAQDTVIQELNLLCTKLEDYNQRMGKNAWRARLSLGRLKKVPPKGLYIWGGVGCGKTMLMDMFFQSIMVSDRRHVHFHRFMQEVHKRIHLFRGAQKAGKLSENNDPIAALARVITDQAWLICFDEFHVTDIADAMILGRLFEALFAHGAVVVTTSNRHPTELYGGGLLRERFLPFIDIFMDKMNIVKLNSSIDYRRLRTQEEGVYLPPNSASNLKKLEEVFKSFTLGERPAERLINSSGRQIRFPLAIKEVGFISFAELCEQPLGPGDYLEVADVFKTLIVSGIPRINAENRDVAKRFVILIDALYEAQVQLICSAEVAPNGIYPEGDGSFEFKRTVSRLIEMQSPYYMSLAQGTID